MFDAAMRQYAAGGWVTFSFEAIARQASAGKAGLYSRWGNRAELLRQTLEQRWVAPAHIDTGNLRDDLLALARHVFVARTGPFARVALWTDIDAQMHPETRVAIAPYAEGAVEQARAIARRGIARGEIGPGVDPGLLMDMVVGGVANHVAATPERLRSAMIAKMESFTERLVDAALHGASLVLGRSQR